PALLSPRTPRPPLFPYTTLFRSRRRARDTQLLRPPESRVPRLERRPRLRDPLARQDRRARDAAQTSRRGALAARGDRAVGQHRLDRKSTRLNSSHVAISYAVFCL